MHRLLGVGVTGIVCLWTTAASASNIVAPGVEPAGSGFSSLASAPALVVDAVDPTPVAVGATLAYPIAASETASPVLTRGTFGIQPTGAGIHVSIDGLILRRPLGESPTVAAPEPGTLVTALVGVAAVLIGRRMRAR